MECSNFYPPEIKRDAREFVFTPHKTKRNARVLTPLKQNGMLMNVFLHPLKQRNARVVLYTP